MGGPGRIRPTGAKMVGRGRPRRADLSAEWRCGRMPEEKTKTSDTVLKFSRSAQE